MPGENSNPYRLPCWLASWPTRQWMTFCAQHAQAAHMSIDEACNAAIDDATPTYATTCAEGTPVNGNCYGDCEKGDATGLTLDGSTYAVGTTIFTLGAGCGSIRVGDRIQFAGDSNTYTVKTLTETTCPTSLSGYPLEIDEPGLLVEITTAVAITILDRGTRDFSQCEFSGWFAVRARTYWHGRNGWGDGCEGCPPCDASVTHYLRLDKSTSYDHVEPPENEADYTWSATRAVECDPATGLLSEPEGACSGSDLDLAMKLFIGGNWACGPAFSETHPDDAGGLGAFMNTLFAAACADESGTASDGFGGVTYDATILTRTETVISLKLEVIDQPSPGYTSTWLSEWTLSEPYTLAEAVIVAYGLADLWDMSDFVQCPPRSPGSWLLEPDGDYHSPIPFVQRREIGVQALEVPEVCGTVPACGAYDPCPFDGATIGAPLPNGTGPHYGFYDPDGVIASLGWNPGYGLPIGATWWTAMDDAENAVADYPAGGWVRVEESVVMVQKWMETKNENASHNFFRPCGADSRVTWAADYRAICGRLAIASVTLDTGTHVLSVVLSEAADYLAVGDEVDFVKYGASPTFTETVDNGASKSSPDTAGYTVATLTDSTHFTIASMAAVPDATHVRSHSVSPKVTPHFQWNDDRRKGDFVWCKEETECIGVTGETTDNACEAGCLPFSPCYPAVAAVLTPDAPEDFGNADIQTLPAEPGNTYRLLWKPRMDEADLLGGEGRVESMCEPPDGAPALPSGVAFAGCGTLPAFRPMRGLGDAVAIVAQPIAREIDKLTSKLPKSLRTNAAGCGGCKKRQAALNKAVPFKPKTTL